MKYEIGENRKLSSFQNFILDICTENKTTILIRTMILFAAHLLTFALFIIHLPCRLKISPSRNAKITRCVLKYLLTEHSTESAGLHLSVYLLNLLCAVLLFTPFLSQLTCLHGIPPHS